jgi:hypothetical protein
VASNPSNQEIVQQMLQHVPRARRKAPLGPRVAQAAQALPPTCGSDFSIDDFAVTYPNSELLANVAVTRVPAGTALLGVTVAAVSISSAAETYCMGVASDSAGLALPISVLGASTSPSFPSATVVNGLVVLYYTQDGVGQQCVIQRQFTVGG